MSAELQPFSPIEKTETATLNTQVATKMRELLESWREFATNQTKLIEISTDPALWLHGFINDEATETALILEIVDNKDMPGAHYSTWNYCIHRLTLIFDKQGKPLSVRITNVQRIRDEQLKSYSAPWVFEVVKLDTATNEELLKIADVLGMYSEPFDYFSAGKSVV